MPHCNYVKREVKSGNSKKSAKGLKQGHSLVKKHGRKGWSTHVSDHCDDKSRSSSRVRSRDGVRQIFGTSLLYYSQLSVG